ncbi:MAG: hypothetical protein V1837_02540 [Candidatus Woesearchaeota archaeon]
MVEANNISSARLTDQLSEAKSLLALGEFNESIKASNMTIVLVNLVINISSESNLSHELLSICENLQFNVTSEQHMLDLAQSEFSSNLFESARRRIADAKQSLESILEVFNAQQCLILKNLLDQAASLNLTSQHLQVLAFSCAAGYPPLEAPQLMSEVTSLNLSLRCLGEVQTTIDILQSLMATPAFSGLYQEELALVRSGQFDSLGSLCSQQAILKEQAIQAYQSLQMLNLQINQSKLPDLQSPRQIAATAEEELATNRFDSAFLLAKQGLAELDRLAAERSLYAVVFNSKVSFHLFVFLVNYWLLLLISALLLSVFSFVSYRSFSRWHTTSSIRNLSRNETIIRKQMQDVQKDYFIFKKLMKEDYESRMDALEANLARVREKLSLFEFKKSKVRVPWLRPKVIKMLKYFLAKLIEYEEARKR